MSVKIDTWLDRLASLLWGLAVLTLPVTSFPYFPFFGKETQVRPLSLYFLAALLPVLFVKFLRGKIMVWNGALTLLVVFVLLTLLATAWGGMLSPLSLRGQDYWGRALRAWITLAIGIIFLLCAIWMNRTPENLRATLRWLYAGLLASGLWGVIQLLGQAGLWIDSVIVAKWQGHFSIAGYFDRGLRIPAFSLEPSWLAGQLATLYFPWLFASLLTGYRVSRGRWPEIVLLAVASFLLIFTYSRSGIALVGAAGLLTAILTGREAIGRAWRWWLAPYKHAPAPARIRLREWSLRLSLGIALLAGLAGSLTILSRTPYFAQLWQSKKSGLVDYLVDIYAGPRLAYAWAALDTFGEHPWLGVGPGASGFYLYERLPAWSRTLLPEIARQIGPLDITYPNPKNLYVRLLAETGILGFSAFVIFYLYLLGRLPPLLASQGAARFLGVAGLFTWLALALYCTTQDSLAMPNLWINMGILLGLAENLPAAGMQNL